MKTKKFVSLALSLASVLGLASCAKNPKEAIIKNDISNEYIETFKEESSSPSVENTYKETVPSDGTTDYDAAEIASTGIYCSDPNYSIPADIKNNLMSAINNFNSSNVSFKLEDINTGTTFSYNAGQTYNGACIVKTSVVLYLLRLAEMGLVDLNKTIPYPGNVVSGSGYLNGYYNGYQAPTGKKFTILEYMFHALYYSDNNAYRILWKYLCNSNYWNTYTKWMEAIGAKSLCPSKDLMWVRSAKAPDAVNVMKAMRSFCHNSKNKFDCNKTFVDGNNLIKLSHSDSNYLTYGQIIYWIMRYGLYDYIESLTEETAISKTGFVSGNSGLACRNLMSYWQEEGCNVAILSKWGSEYGRKKVMNDIIKSLDQLQAAYDKFVANQAKKLSLSSNNNKKHTI